MFRQNAVLNDFVNFLKARGRFREIEFIDNSVCATPRIPGFPTLVFYIEEHRSEQHYTLEIHGDESTVMNREILEFFQLNQLDLKKTKVKYYITSENNDSLIVEAEGVGPPFEPFETLTNHINNLFNAQQYSITTTQKTLVFSSGTNESGSHQSSSQQVIQPQTRIQTTPPKISPITSPDAILENFKERSSLRKEQIGPSQRLTPPMEFSDPLKGIEHSRTENVPSSTKEMSKSSSSDNTKSSDANTTESDFTEPLAQDTILDEDLTPEDLEEDLFHPKPPSKAYPTRIKPYLKQTTSLFRRDNWEEDLPTEIEMEILERTYMRIKHRTKPEILAKDFNIPIDEAESYLRSLISKGLLRTQVGWYIIKKSHLPFFKKTFSDTDKKKKKKKSPRISRVGEGLTPEEIATIKAIKARPNLKAQSNLLTRPTGLKQSVLKEVLRNLVEKGILRVSYGWYILKDKHILEHKRGPALDQANESLQYEIPKDLDLSPSEEKVIQALLQRPHYKAQSNLLTPELKLPKEQIKQVLRELVEKGICNVKFGWYCLKDPEKFQSS